MALNAVEQVTEQVPADDFEALEQKIYRTIEMYKAARQAQAAAERDAQRVRQQLEERDEQLVALRREAVASVAACARSLGAALLKQRKQRRTSCTEI